MSTKTPKSAKPSTPQPSATIADTMLRSLRRYGGNPDLMLKENPHRIRKPMPDRGKQLASPAKSTSSVLSKEQLEQSADKGLKQAIHGLTNWRDHKPKY